jgi:gluconate 5-dehydrogenase
MAEGLAELGADLVLCSRHLERCQRTAGDLRKLGVRAVGLRCDVRDPHEVETVVERTRSELGRIDVLVNNSGTVWGASPEDMPLEGWQKVVDVNLTGTFLFSQAAGRVMIEQRGGKIVNIASVLALTGARPEIMNAIAYNATKGGILSFTRDLACKWAQHGITVNAIAPGWFPSDMSTRSRSAASAGRTISRAPSGFSPRRPRTTSRGRRSWSTAGNRPGELGVRHSYAQQRCCRQECLTLCARGHHARAP